MKSYSTSAVALALIVTASRASSAQILENRIASASGTVGFEFATHGNVCGDGNGIFISDDTSPGWNLRRQRSGTNIRHGGDDGPCDIAPARALVDHDGSRVSSVRISVGGSPRRADNELGNVPAQDAVRFLLGVAPRLDGRSADDAIAGAAIADVANVWPQLLDIARDDKASESSRKSSLFWVSHQAGIAAVKGLESVAQDDDAASSVRSDALFYLAHRQDGAGIEPLIRVVRTSKSAKMRKDAVWYLGQSRDPRALALFADLLAGH